MKCKEGSSISLPTVLRKKRYAIAHRQYAPSFIPLVMVTDIRPRPKPTISRFYGRRPRPKPTISRFYGRRPKRAYPISLWLDSVLPTGPD